MAYGELNGHLTDDVTLTPKGQIRDPNTLTAQYLKNSWRCYLATIASLLWGSVVGWPSNSLASGLNVDLTGRLAFEFSCLAPPRLKITENKSK